MAAVAGRRERGGHQRSNSTPVGSTTTTATRNNSNRNFSTSSTTATPTAASLTTPQHQRLLSKSSTASTSSANHDPAAAPQPQSARRRLTSTKRHSSSLSQSQSVSVSPLAPNNSVSGRQDSSTTTVSAVNPPVVPNKRHSAPSADLITTRSRPTNPLHQRSASSSSSPAPTRHSRKPSDGPSVTTGRGPDSATTTRTSRTSTLGSSRTSRTTAAASSPARTPATTSTTRRTATSSPARTPAASRSSAAAKPQPPVSKPTHRRADSASVPSSRSSRASTSPIPPQPAPPVPSSANPPSAPPPPEASSAGIPPQIQAELDKNASIQVTQPPRRAKAPARFSSNGIATADAPPPSLAYRQIPLTAAPPPPPAIPPPPPAPQPPPPRPSVEDEVEDFQYPPPLEEDNSNSKALVTIEVDDRYLSPPTQQTQEETMTTYETEQYSRSNGGVLTNGFAGKYNATVEDDEPTITTLRDIQRIAQEERSFASSPNPLTSSRTAPSQNGDDPFLNLARSSTPRSQALLDAQARQERRRSRMMQYSVNNGRTSNLAHEYSSTTSSRPTKSTASTIVSDDSYGGVELSQEPQYQAPEQNIEADHSLSHRSSFLRRQRESQNGHVRSISEAPPRTTLTRANGTSGELPSGAPRPSQSVLRSPISTLIESDRAKNAAQARLGINDDAQSTISSGTVWDELDELKMRIKRLELTGTTAATTVSNSPRHQPQQSNSNNNNNEAAAAPSPTATGPPPTIHPVLHAALAKTKIVLPDHIIKALDALANDTLNLAEAVGSTGQSTMSINPALNSPEKQLVTDRQIRRKVDNICRSLTELCVSLADGRMPFDPPPDNQVQTMPVVPQPQIQQPQIQQPPQQPPPQVQTSVFPPRVEDPIERTNTAFDYRSPSAIGHKIDREATVTPNSAARAHARFEARRASLLGAPSPQYISRQEASPSPQPGANRLSHRNSMSLRGGGDRRSMIEPEDELDMQQIPNYRSPSRASNLNTSTAHLSPLRTTFTGQSYEVSPMQRTLTLREQRAAQQAQQLEQFQQAQTNLEIASNSYLSASGLQHRRTYSTASTITPTSSSGLGLTTQRRSYLDRERGITDNIIGTALTTGSGVGSAAQPIDISRRRTEYLRAANGEQQQQQQQIQTEMGYSPPQSCESADDEYAG
ncbi:hypothetical protein TWF173_000667 [Orbilia oligospora]|nr:hypothetical protein TWF173_000667 [Orbilia oligospora]